MKLFLCSSGFDNERLIPRFEKLIGRKAAGLKTLFIPTALNTPRARESLDLFLEDLYKIGISDADILTVELDSPVSSDIIQRIGLIFVCPGDPEFLMDKLHSSGFDKTLRKLLKNDIPFIGVSAGADILASNLSNGINCINLKIECHGDTGSPDGPVDEDGRTVRLTDNQALIIDGRQCEIVS